MMSNARIQLLALVCCLLAEGVQAQENNDWKPGSAAQYLDKRAEEWFAFDAAERGHDATRTSCISCHTLAPYALARPLLRKRGGTQSPTPLEAKLLAQVRLRVAHWADIDKPELRLLYDFSDQKKRESWGTEAVLNALVLSANDGYARGASPETVAAFANLWKTQVTNGPEKGSWDWLDFGNEPYESSQSRYFGASLAAAAVAAAPDHAPGQDNDAGRALLDGYLKDAFAKQNLFNRACGLWASPTLSKALPADVRKDLVDKLLAQQQGDGGWCLAKLGAYKRRDKTEPSSASDGLATGLTIRALVNVGVARDDPRIAKGITWLKRHQQSDGSWPCASSNKNRKPESFAGKLMTDAATAFAVIALVER